MGEQPGYIPPEAQKSIARRDHLGPRLMREVTRGPSDEFLEKRAEWMIGNSKIGEYLRPKIVFEDRLAGKVEKGVSVLAVGAGKGHEIDEMDSILPGSKITGLDPHDFYAPPVEKRIRELSHNAKYLGADSRAEQIAGIHDQSQDGVTLFFTRHHISIFLHQSASVLLIVFIFPPKSIGILPVIWSYFCETNPTVNTHITK